MTKEFERLIGFITDVRNNYPEVKDADLDNNGEIMYANANDGTDFDFGMNDRLCEFMIYHGKKLGEKGFIKTTVDRDGTVTSYVFPNGEMSPVNEFSKTLFDEDEVLSMYERLMDKADGMSMYDKYLYEIDL